MSEKSCANCGVPLSDALRVCVRCVRGPLVQDNWLEKPRSEGEKHDPLSYPREGYDPNQQTDPPEEASPR